MDGQDIRISLDLPGVRVTGQRQGAGGIEVWVERAARTAPCPGCRREVAKVHDRRPRRKRDLPLGERSVTVVVVRRRFRCRAELKRADRWRGSERRNESGEDDEERAHAHVSLLFLPARRSLGGGGH